MAAWNLAEEQWGPLAVQVEIEEEVTYHAVMVLFADDEPGNFDGRISGYLDGEEFEVVPGADLLYGHTNDNAIGGLAGQALLADGSQVAGVAGGGFFAGAIDEVAIYNIALDDPDGDGDLGDSLVADHFLAGSDEVGEQIVFKRGDTDASGVVDISDPIFNLTFQFVGGIDELPCEDSADVDDSGVVDISDPIYNLTFQFVGGIAPPPAPGPTDCGSDPTNDERTCDNYPPEKC